MYDLVDMASQMTPEERAMIQAQALRRQQFGDRLQQANQQAGRFNNLAAITQMANNPAAAAAAAAAQRNAQTLRPVQMGNQGFMLPGSGEFVASPIYEDEKQADRDNRRAVLRETLASREALAREAEQGRNDRAEDQAQLRRELAAQQRALAMTLAGLRQGGSSPAQVRADEAQRKQEEGRTGVSDTLTSLSSLYRQLNEKGGIVNTDKPFWQNVPARLSTTAGGQFAAQFVGTQEQSIRNQIEQVRPLLLMDIKNATGMSAGQMNSNMELQTYLATATNPRLDLQANLAAIDFLDKKYGLGRGIAGQLAGQARQRAPQQGQNPVQPGVNLPRAIPPRQQVPQLNLPPGFRVIGPAE